VTPDQWEEIKDRLHEALELEPASRSAYLKEIAARDSDVASEVESLLASYQDMHSDFMSARPSASPGIAPLAEPLLGRHLGPYVMVELIGAGGMGEVFRAVRTDGQFEREVAIKLVRTDLNSQTAVNRFKNERQILASLDHPNIAHLLDGDVTVEGIPYLVMELIYGDPIDSYCNRQKLTLEQRLQLFLKVCSAVQYAHQPINGWLFIETSSQITYSLL
jgi:serine/threonine protein kinase